jgi:hypothetical protein
MKPTPKLTTKQPNYLKGDTDISLPTAPLSPLSSALTALDNNISILSDRLSNLQDRLKIVLETEEQECEVTGPTPTSGAILIIETLHRNHRIEGQIMLVQDILNRLVL